MAQDAFRIASDALSDGRGQISELARPFLHDTRAAPVSTEAAFGLIRQHARSHQMPLSQVARQLVTRRLRFGPGNTNQEKTST